MGLREDLKIKPSPYKKRFRALGVRTDEIAVYIGVTYNHLVKVFNGVFPVSAEVKAKLDKLIADLNAEDEAASKSEKS